jgi:hypothetical protein
LECDSIGIKNLLTNPGLVGLVEYTPAGKKNPVQVKASWEPFVDVDLFRAVEKELEQRNRQPRTAKRRKRGGFPPKPGCAHCGGEYHGGRLAESQGRTRSYVHTKPKKHMDPEAHQRFMEGTAAGEPRLPSPTHTLRAKPVLPERRIAEPREKASHAASSSAISSSSMSDGDAVPGCDLDAPGSSCTPNGGSPGIRAAKPGSDVGVEKRRVKGHTSWVLCRLTGYEIPLS